MKLPAIIVNCKMYPQVEGEKALDLALVCEKVSKKTGVNIVICPPMVELSRIASHVEIPVFAQHVDFWKDGAGTGRTSMTAAKAAGASGTLINHSERRLKLADIEELVRGCRDIGLETIVCSNNVKVSMAAAMLGPDYVAMEPPELIGGDVSVTSADPEIVKDTVEAIRKVAPDVEVLTGAGVKTGADVEKALELGTKGVLLASGVVKASDPGKVLEEMAESIKH
jgi:triosephosphate isomerase